MGLHSGIEAAHEPLERGSRHRDSSAILYGLMPCARQISMITALQRPHAADHSGRFCLSTGRPLVLVSRRSSCH